jgi:hypothetical protein
MKKVAALRAMRDATGKMGANEARVSKMATDTFGPDADAVMTLMKSHANMWAEHTKQDADEWFARVQDIRKSDPAAVGADALMQSPETLRSPEFKNWFGDWEADPVNASKVVDHTGSPLRVYHGTGTPDLGVADAVKHNESLRKAAGEWDKYTAAEKEAGPLRKSAQQAADAVKSAFADAVGDVASKKQKHIPFDHKVYDFSSKEALAKSIYKEATYTEQEAMWTRGTFRELNGVVSTTIDDPTFARLAEAHRSWVNAEEATKSINPRPSSERPAQWMFRNESPAFNTRMYGANDPGYYAAGAHFTDNADEAGEYASHQMRGNPGVIPAYVNIRKPFVLGETVDAAAEQFITEAVDQHRQVAMRNSRGDLDALARAFATGRTEGLKRAGYDGMVVKTGKGTEYIVFDPTQIKSTMNRGTFDPNDPNILFQSAPYKAEPFYSKIMDAVDAGKIPNKVGRDQLMKTLVGYGVKQEELADMQRELDALFAAAPDGKVSKDDVFDLAADKAWNGVQVTELSDAKDREALSRVDNMRFTPPEGIPDSESYQALSRATERARVLDSLTPVRFRGYQVPGGVPDTYRELLIRHPSAKGFIEGNHFSGLADDVIAHVRMDDVNLPDGSKALRIQEIQSDLHQNARNLQQDTMSRDARIPRKLADGKTNPAFTQWVKNNEHRYPIESFYDGVNDWSPIPEFAQWDIDGTTKTVLTSPSTGLDIARRVVDGKEQYGLFDGAEIIDDAWYDSVSQAKHDAKFSAPSTQELPPYAAFKASWHELALKSVIRKAAEEGYDKIALVRGADIANAVGGPPDALGKFYDEKLTNTLKKMVVKRGGKVDDVMRNEPLQWMPASGGTPNKYLADLAAGATVEAIVEADGAVSATVYKGGRYHSQHYAASLADLDDKLLDANRLTTFEIPQSLRDEVLQKGQPLYQQGARGAVQFAEDGKVVIHAFQSADMSTLVHEASHVFRKSLEELNGDLLNRAAEAVGVPKGSKWTREHEEVFARGFEDYMRTGTAPTRELRSVFYKFKQWLTDIYKSLVGSDPGKVSPQLRSVFDEMLGSKMAPGPSVTGSHNIDSFVMNLMGLSDVVGKQALDLADATRRTFKQQMTPGPRGTQGEVMQRASELHTLKEEEFVKEASQSVSAVSNAINEIVGYRPGSVDEAAEVAPHALLADDVVTAAETGDYSALPEQLIEPAKQMAATGMANQRKIQEAGHTRPMLSDQFVEHFPHSLNPTLQAWMDTQDFGVHGIGSPKADAASNARANQSARDDLFRDAVQGRRTWNGVTSDPEILEMLKDYTVVTDAAAKQGMIDAATAKIAEKYGSEIDPRMIVPTEGMYADKITVLDSLKNEIELPWEVFQKEYVRVNPVNDMRTVQGRLAEFQSPPLFVKAADALLNGPLAQRFMPSRKNMENRHAELAKWMSDKYQPLQGNKGMFSSEPITSFQERIFRDGHTYGALKAVPEILTGALKSRLILPPGGKFDSTGYTLESILTSSLYSRSKRGMWYDQMADTMPDLKAVRDSFMQKENPDGFYAFMDNMRMDRDLAQEILQTADMLQKGSQTLAPMSKAFRGATALFKSGVLTHPGRIIRDVASAVVALGYNSMLSTTSLEHGIKALMHNGSEAVQQIPAVKAWMSKYGIPDTPEGATRALHEIYASLKGHGQSLYRDPNLDTMSLAEQLKSGMEGIEQAFPGTGITSFGSPLQSTKRILSAGGPQRMWRQLKTEREAGFFGDAGAQLSRAWQSGTWNPFDIAGVPHVVMTDAKVKQGIRRGDVRASSEFKPAKVFDIIGKNADDAPRFVGLLEGLLQGKSPEEAWKGVSRVLLDYDPKKFGPLENKALKKIFPFYSFLRQQSVYLGSELMTNPTGRLGKLIRVARLSQPNNQFLPEHVAESLAIPVGGESEDGTQNYLTGLGLMFEDPPKLLSEGPFEFARAVLSRTNPLIKGVAEAGLGRSAFQGGPLGARDLADMDPALGRIFTNLGLQDEAPGGNARPAFGSRPLEFFLSNSPVSRILSTVKTITEEGDRKNPLEKAMNVLTGLRITSVSPQVRQRGLREYVNAQAKELGARPFSDFTISDALLDDARARSEEDYQRLIAIDQLKDTWDQKRKGEQKAKREAEGTVDKRTVRAEQTRILRRTGRTMTKQERDERVRDAMRAPYGSSSYYQILTGME